MEFKILSGSLRTVMKDTLTAYTYLNPETVMFDYGNVLVNKNYLKQGGVRIMSGGSYPLGAFVGRGMLTAAVQGDSFISPPSKIILRTIRELMVSNIEGVLIVILASSGNLINFGVATERALNDNLRVRLLPVYDKWSDKQFHKASCSALNEVVIASKLAGAMSERKKNIDNIHSFCSLVLESTRSKTINIARDVVKCPCGTEKFDFNQFAGNAARSQTGPRNMCLEVVNDILELPQECDPESTPQERSFVSSTAGNRLAVSEGDALVVFVNSQGLSNIEDLIFSKELISVVQGLQLKVQRFYIGSFIETSSSSSYTVTMLKVISVDVILYLDDTCTALGWKSFNQNKILTEPQPLTGMLRRRDRLGPPIRGPKLNDKAANLLLFSVQFACDALISCERQLNIIDADNGDGDSGTRLKNISQVLLRRMMDNKLVVHYPFTFFESLSKLLEHTVGGSLGGIYSILFEAAARSFVDLDESTTITPFTWLEALERAAATLQRYGDVKIGDNTMFEPIHGCAIAIRTELESGSHFLKAYGRGVGVAEELAQKTKKQGNKYPDSGAHAVGIWMRALLESVKLHYSDDEN